MLKKKNLLSLILALCLCFALTTPALASENAEIDLYEIANSTVQVTEAVQESGAVVTTFENLNGFVEEVRNNHLEISDIDLAKFIMEFTEQNSEGLPENEILDMLEYDNISTSNVYLLVDEQGMVEELSKEEALIAMAADWTSTDGVMQITTSSTKTKTSGSQKYFTVWAHATWLKINVNKMSDVFVLGTNAFFNDAFTEQGNVNQTFVCQNGCSRQTTRYRSVNANSTVDADLVMNYDNFVPCLYFDNIDTRCDYCTSGSSAKCTSFSAYIKYGIIAEGTANIQAAYGHKTFGFGNISVAISATGLPVLSIGAGGSMKSYTARAVTLS